MLRCPVSKFMTQAISFFFFILLITTATFYNQQDVHDGDKDINNALSEDLRTNPLSREKIKSINLSAKNKNKKYHINFKKRYEKNKIKTRKEIFEFPIASIVSEDEVQRLADTYEKRKIILNEITFKYITKCHFLKYFTSAGVEHSRRTKSNIKMKEIRYGRKHIKNFMRKQEKKEKKNERLEPGHPGIISNRIANNKLEDEKYHKNDNKRNNKLQKPFIHTNNKLNVIDNTTNNERKNKNRNKKNNKKIKNGFTMPNSRYNSYVDIYMGRVLRPCTSITTNVHYFLMIFILS